MRPEAVPFRWEAKPSKAASDLDSTEAAGRGGGCPAGAVRRPERSDLCSSALDAAGRWCQTMGLRVFGSLHAGQPRSAGQTIRWFKGWVRELDDSMKSVIQECH